MYSVELKINNLLEWSVPLRKTEVMLIMTKLNQSKKIYSRGSRHEVISLE